MSKPRVYIAFPCHGQTTAETAHSLFMLGVHIGMDPVQEWVGFERYSSSNLSHSRAWLAANAGERGATHILWIDADMKFPRDSLHRLLARGEKIVGANYTRRAPPYTPSATDLDRKPLYTKEDSAGMEAAGVIGFGLLLTEISVFHDLPDPWFSQWDQGSYCTEDVPWCRKVREAGHTIWVDHDLSKEVSHIGSVAFTHADAVGG